MGYEGVSGHVHGKKWTYTWPMVTSAGEMLVGVVDVSNGEWRAMTSGKPGGGDVEVLCARCGASARRLPARVSRDLG